MMVLLTHRREGNSVSDELSPEWSPVFVPTSSLGPGRCLTETREVQLLYLQSPAVQVVLPFSDSPSSFAAWEFAVA